jgi:hypothetical protein
VCAHVLVEENGVKDYYHIYISTRQHQNWDRSVNTEV